MYTLCSLGKEKAYYAWGVELINEIMMIEAGMERFVKFKKGDFVGREALLQRQKEQLDWNIAYVEVDAEDAEVCSGEPAYDGDGVIGVATSGSYGHKVNKSLAFVFVPSEYANLGTTFDIEILSHRRQAKVLAEAAYDPKNKRLRS
jgi:dimethylglycine dehydrogenase